MNSDYILKGRSQLALHKPEWAYAAPSASASVSSAAPATASFEAAVKAHDAAYETVKETVKHTSGTAKGTHRYAKAEAITEQLNRASSPSARTQEADETVAEQPAQTSSATSSEIGEDGSLYPERNKTDAAKMNAFNHSGISKKSVGPGVDTVDYTFEDFLDTINPLQQIPIVNMIYRNLTGDKISGVAQVMGSALFWGPTGIITGAVDAIFEQEKGGDVGQTMMASLLGTETPGARDLPSNKAKIKAQETMLADASNINTSATVVASQTPSVHAPSAYPVAAKQAPAKQPFGGVMGNEQPRVANIANDDAQEAPETETADVDAVDPVDAESARILAAATPAAPAPVNHKPIEADGHKMFSLAGVPRHPSIAAHMPLRDMPDVRLKTYGKEIAKSTPAGNLKDGAGLLGLQKPAAALAAAPTDAMDIPATVLPDPGFTAPMNMPAANGNVQTPSGNQIPAQLIQDMMLMNMQKYQDGLKNGTRGSSLDING